MKTLSKFNLVLLLALGLALLLIPACGNISGNVGGTVTSAHTLIVEPDDGRTAVIAAIGSAESTISLTIYSLSDPTVEAALKSASANGAAVRVLYNYFSFPPYEKDNVLKTMASLEAAGILTKAATSEFTVTHQKTFTFDGTKAIIMTFNLAASYFGGTRDFGVITTYPDEVAEIARVFNADWGYTPVSPEAASLVWSNVNSRAKLLALIRSATVSVEVYNEELEDQECLDALTAEAAAGVTVRVISAQLGGTGEADGNRIHREYLNAHGVAAKYMPTADYLYCHAKMVLVDYGTSSARVFLGSENFSSTSLNKNRELGILLNETDILARLHATFETDWPRCAFD
jgi:cardiolipin synthase